MRIILRALDDDPGVSVLINPSVTREALSTSASSAGGYAFTEFHPLRKWHKTNALRPVLDYAPAHDDETRDIFPMLQHGHRAERPLVHFSALAEHHLKSHLPALTPVRDILPFVANNLDKLREEFAGCCCRDQRALGAMTLTTKPVKSVQINWRNSLTKQI